MGKGFANRFAAVVILLMCGTVANAVGTPAGTVVENTATVSFGVNGNPVTVDSNTTMFTVAERIDVVVTLQSPQQLVAANDSNQALLFTVANTGNATETFTLAIDSVLAGDDFDPVPSPLPIYFDSDASGDFSAGDQAYTPGSNDPVLVADASVDVLILNDIPGTAVDGNIGFSQLSATSRTGSGAPGTVFSGQGDGGVDAVIGLTGGEGRAAGEYLVADVAIRVVKAQAVADPFGGSEALPGATITYTITVEVTNSGTATASVVRDPMPAFTTYVPDSIVLSGTPISDASDGDAGEYDTAGVPAVVVRLGDLTQADGPRSIVFQVTID